MRTIFTEIGGQRRVFVRETSTLGAAQKLIKDIQTDAGVATEAAVTAQQAQAAAEAARDDAVAATVNKLNLNGDNVGANGASLRSNIDVYSTSQTVALLGDKADLDGANLSASNAADFVEALGLNARLPLTPDLFGAVDYATNPSADATTAIQNWINAGRTLGLPLDGRGKTYRVTQCAATVANLFIDNVTLKEANPNAGDPVTLTLTPHVANVGSVWLGEGFKVDRSGDGTAGTLNVSAGVYINGVPYVTSYAEIYGDAKGSGLLIDNAIDVDDYTVVHDMRCDHTGITDDIQHGVWVRYCENVRHYGQVYNLGNKVRTGAERDRYNRGYAASGCKRVAYACEAYNVDQGIDVTGDSGSGNTQVSLVGARTYNTFSVGAKMANCVVSGDVSGLTVDQSGLCAVLLSGPSTTNFKNMTRNIRVSVVARNIGTNGFWANPAVVKLDRGSGSGDLLSQPKGSFITGCKASYDDVPMTFTVANTNTLTLTSFGPLETGLRVRLTTTGTLPTGLATGTDYWIIDVEDTNNVQLASSHRDAMEGVPITGLSGGSGTHTMTGYMGNLVGVLSNITVYDKNAPNIVRNNDWGTIPRGDTVPDIEASAVRASGQLIPHNTNTPIDYSSATDPYSLVTLSGPNGGVLTALRDGLYAFEFLILWDSASGGTVRITQLQRSTNGGSDWALVLGADSRIPDPDVLASVPLIWRGRLNRNDQLRVIAFQDRGAATELYVRSCVFRWEG